MPVKNRTSLKTIFTGKTLPTWGNYEDLIDSMLNRKEDQFFGRWRQGKRYCQGDVVIYGKSLYLLALPEVEELVLCPGDADPPASGKDDGPMRKQQPDQTATADPADPLCICSDIPPPDDKARWCELQLEVDDKDWQVILDEEDGEPTVVYNLKAKIGIGTDAPGTRLQVSGSAGDVHVDPDGADPTVSLVAAGDEARRVDWSLGSTGDWVTDSLGYAFFRLPGHSSEPASPPVLLLFLTSSDERPAAGIGTDEPRGILHAEDEGYGRFVVNHRKGNEAASVLLVDCTDAGNGYYLLNGVNQSYAYWQTDASEGLRIIMGGSMTS